MSDLPEGSSPRFERIRINKITGTLEFTIDNGVTWTASGAGGSSDIVASVVSVANLSLTGAATVDGVALSTGQVCLAAGQTDHTQIGPYTVNTAGAWTRVTAFATAAQMQAAFTAGLGVRVLGGSLYAGSIWLFTTPGTITVGTTALTFTEMPGSGALAGLTLAQSRLTLAPQYFASVSGASVGTLSPATALNGDLDGDYDVFISIVCGHAGATFQIEPNGQTAGLKQSITDMLHGGVAGASWYLAGYTGSYPLGVGLGDVLTFSGTIRAKTGQLRMLSLGGFADQTADDLFTIYGVWTDTSTLLASLPIVSSQTDGIAAGSFYRLTAKGQ